MVKKRRLGWKKDRYDKRDWLRRAVPVRELPSVVDLSQYLPDVRQQGNVGSCVGFGIGGNLVSHAKQLGVYTEWFSPTWIYNGARYLEGTLRYDDGCYPKDALEWLRDKGCLLEHFWPYNPLWLDKSSPPSKYNAEAAKFPLLEYYRAVDGVDGICSALAGGDCVSIGTPWFSKWRSAKADGVLAEVTARDSVAGGHETCLYGYNRETGFFFGINSWGTEWGNAGLFQMPFSAFSTFKQCGGYDAHFVRVNWGEPPEPEPKPPQPEPPEPKPPEPKGQFRVRGQFTSDGGGNWTTIIDVPLLGH